MWREVVQIENSSLGDDTDERMDWMMKIKQEGSDVSAIAFFPLKLRLLIIHNKKK